jgi:hypothetical protein
MALSNNLLQRPRASTPYQVSSGLTTDAITIYPGAILVIKQSTGLIGLPNNSADDFPVGIATTHETIVTDNTVVEYARGWYWIQMNTVAAQVDAGKLVYALDDEKVTLTAGASIHPLGTVKKVDLVNDLVLVDFFEKDGG